MVFVMSGRDTNGYERFTRRPYGGFSALNAPENDANTRDFQLMYGENTPYSNDETRFFSKDSLY